MNILQKSYFLLLTATLINSCGNSTRASAEVSVETTKVNVGEEVTVSAKHSKFSSISWYIDEELETRCSQKTTCTFIFEEAGEFTVKVSVTSDPPTFPIILPMPTSDSAKIQFTVLEEE